MKILWVKIGGLWPANTGGRLRSYHILSELGKRHEVTVITTHRPGEDVDEIRRKLPFCREYVSFRHASAKKHSLRFILTLMGSWFSPLPVDLYKNRPRSLRREVSRRLRDEKHDLCIADFLVAVPNIDSATSTPVIYFSHNVEYMIWKRLCETQTSWWRKLLLQLEWRKLYRFEKAASRRVDLTLAVSGEDSGHLRRISGVENIHSIPTGVDVEFFRPAGVPVTEQPPALVFTGSMDWYPNDDAMVWFIDSILPSIREHMPGVTLAIVGRNPSRRLREFGRRRGVKVTGTVDDIRSWVQSAAVYIVPLRVGGGTRLKIFEALAMGKAIVSTSIGAEGLPLQNGIHFLRADDPATFAGKTLELLRNPELREKLGKAGRHLVAEHYSWERVTDVFENYCMDVQKTVSASGEVRPDFQ